MGKAFKKVGSVIPTYRLKSDLTETPELSKILHNKLPIPSPWKQSYKERRPKLN